MPNPNIITQHTHKCEHSRRTGWDDVVHDCESGRIVQVEYGGGSAERRSERDRVPARYIRVLRSIQLVPEEKGKGRREDELGTPTDKHGPKAEAKDC